MGKQPGAAAGLRDHLKPMRQHVRHAARATKLDVVMHRMVVAAGQLKGRKQRIGHGARRQYKFLTYGEVFEVARFAQAVVSGVK